MIPVLVIAALVTGLSACASAASDAAAPLRRPPPRLHLSRTAGCAVRRLGRAQSHGWAEESYDACATLSWIVVPLTNCCLAGYPFAIMLFYDGGSTAGPFDTATSTFTWDDGEVVREGNLPAFSF